MTAQWICRRVTAGSLILLAIATARAQTATQSPAALPAPATQPNPTTQPVSTSAANSDLTSLSLEDLMNVQVTSVSKQPQKIADAPAAITVIGPDEIQRSGLSNIPELLRLVPGMDVERVNANRWAITSRGLNGTFADDLLVLMDGRSEYTPVFGGVRWASVDYPLEDLDRIEAIRGPGATLWGSNAVNGVVNIETKSARDTQGVLLDSQLSTDESEQTARYGGQIDPDTFYRVYEKASYTDSGVTPLNDPAHDEWSSYQSGFRIDRYSTPQDTLTLQGDGYYQNLLDTYTVLSPPEMLNDYQSGGNLEGRWTHTDSVRSSSELQIYYERTDSDEFPAPSYEDTYDVSFQNRFPLGDRQEMTWGLGA
ncbi:MAG: TonB-dependent receptor plug domain-containing protein, partial [Tepidisphaeraceae bacterium]